MKVTYVSWVRFLNKFSHLYTENRKIIPGDNVEVPEHLYKSQRQLMDFFGKEDIIPEEQKQEQPSSEVCQNCLKIMTRCKCQREAERRAQISRIEEIDKKAIEEENSEDKPKQEIVIDTSKAKEFVEEKIALEKSLKEEGKTKLEIKEEVKKLKKSKGLKKCASCGKIYSSDKCECLNPEEAQDGK